MLKVCEDCKYASFDLETNKVFCSSYEADVSNLGGDVCPRFEPYVEG